MVVSKLRLLFDGGGHVAGKNAGALFRLTGELGRYAVVGILNTLTGFGVFAFLITLNEEAWFAVASIYISHGIVSPFAYLAHRKWVFGSKTAFFRGFWKFQVAYLIPLILNGPILFAALILFSGDPLVTQGIITIFFVLTTFILNKNFVFRRRTIS